MLQKFHKGIIFLLLVSGTFVSKAQTRLLFGSEKSFTPMFVGFNTNIVNNNSGQPFNEPNAIGVVKAMSPNMLRFPGGDVANQYEWTTDRVGSTTLGFSNFIDLCDKAVGAVGDGQRIEPLLVINLYTLNLSEQQLIDRAVAWLKHVNGKGTGQLNLKVRYWELGNEFYYTAAWGSRYPGTDGHIIFESLAKRCAIAMRAAQAEIDASFPLFIVAASKAPSQFRNPGPDPSGSDIDLKADLWTEALANATPRWWDAIQYHPYINGRAWTTPSSSFTSLADEAQWAFSATYYQPKLMYDYVNKGYGANTKVWHTEYGVVTLPVGNPSNNTFLNGLASADYILGMAEYSEMNQALLCHQVYGSNYGMFTYSGSTPNRKALSFAFDLVHPLIASASKQIPVSIENGSFLSGDIAWNTASKTVQWDISKVPATRASCFVAKDGKINIALINKSSVQQTLQLEGVSGTGTFKRVAGTLNASSVGPTTGVVSFTETSKSINLPAYSLTVITLDGRLTSLLQTDRVEAISEWDIFPNPSKGLIAISASCTQALNYKIALVNSLGQSISVSAGIFQPGKNEFKQDISQFSAGIYNILIETPSGNISKKLIIEN